MNKFQEAIKELENGIKLYVDKVIEKSPRDMTYNAVIYSGGMDGYNIKLNNQIYENIPTIGGICTLNETVTVLVPQNNYNNMVILKASEGGGSGGSGAVSSVNGRIGAVVLNYQDVGALSNLTSIPNKTSQLSNDSGYITNSAIVDYAQPKGNYALKSELFSRNYNDLSNKPTIPKNTSELVNDTNFVSDVMYVHTDNNLTNYLRQNIEDNTTSRHTHTNKSVLDGIIQSVIDKWNTVVNKVDKVNGMGLSTNDYTTTEKNKLSGIEDGAQQNVQCDWMIATDTQDSFIKNKPTKVSQFVNDVYYIVDSKYVHTDNNYTTTEKNKLSGVASGAEVNVQPDWSVSDNMNDGFIKNKPTKLSQFTNDSNFISDANYVHTDNNYTTTEKNKLSGISNGAEVNVKSDWTVTDTANDGFIKNKPTKLSEFTNDLMIISEFGLTINEDGSLNLIYNGE